MNKAIFFDRDGTINEDFGYVFEKDKLVFKEKAVEGLILAKKKGYLIIIITNQSGIGRGLCSLKDVEAFNSFMKFELEKKGAIIDAIYVCPHVDSDKCSCRKPEVGLFLQAAKEFDIDLKRSYCVGDKPRDITPLKNYGAQGCLVYHKESNFITYDNLYEFVNKFVK